MCYSSLPLGCRLTQPSEKAGNIGLGLREETIQKTLGATDSKRLGPKIWACLMWVLCILAPGGFAPYLLLWGQSIAASRIEYNRRSKGQLSRCVGERRLQKPPGLACKSMVARGQEDVHPQKPFVQRRLSMETHSTVTAAAEGWWHRSRVAREAPVLWCPGKGSRSPPTCPPYPLCCSAHPQMAHGAWDFHCPPCQHSPSCQETIPFFSLLTLELPFLLGWARGLPLFCCLHHNRSSSLQAALICSAGPGVCAGMGQPWHEENLRPKQALCSCNQSSLNKSLCSPAPSPPALNQCSHMPACITIRGGRSPRDLALQRLHLFSQPSPCLGITCPGALRLWDCLHCC